MSAHRTGVRIGRWIFLKYFYKGSVYNRYEPFPNPYATIFGRVRLALHLLFYVISMVALYSVCRRLNSLFDLEKDRRLWFYKGLRNRANEVPNASSTP